MPDSEISPGSLVTAEPSVAPLPGSEATGSEPREPSFHVVGIGASAGGLEALERLFEHMPERTGMAFVVVQHLSPEFKSVMDELLARKTQIPIHRVENGVQVKPDAIYLIPPKKDMIIANGRLLLTDKDPRQLVSLPIDHLFRSLASDSADRAIGIVLSGTGSDGSRGIQDIHDAGGLVIAQSPESAKFDGMPKSAMQTGACDLVLSPEDMPYALMRYVKHPSSADARPAHFEDLAPEIGMDRVFRLLRESHGIDFTHYKSSTVARRIDRRLLLNRSVDIDDYVRGLESNKDELNNLYKDLLIGVTRFFRDTEAFERLARKYLPAHLAEHAHDDEFRVWVAGCATGEEAYSVAMTLDECIARSGRSMQVKIFATDAHRASLDHASAGVYHETQLTDVSPERRERYFVRTGDGLYQVTQELRQMVVFAPHNLLRDAPFTKLDLISCRNLLIYFQEAAQRKVLSLFHFGLKTGGLLFLGPSESPGELNDEFNCLDPHWKVYSKRRDIRLLADLRLPLSPGTSLRAGGGGAAAKGGGTSFPDQNILGTYDALLDRYMPPSLLVNEQREVVESFGGANRFLQMKGRRVSTDVCDLVDPALKVLLSGALPRVFMDRQTVSYKGVLLGEPREQCLVNVTVMLVENKRASAEHALIVLEEEGAPPPRPAIELDVRHASQEQILGLESELRYAKENLQATIEELETSNEELQATNEELVASNEELQSTNEELHSVNEELYTVNAEYQKKISELTELTADMDNLLESTQIHTLFLDKDLRIRKFTPRIAETFNLMPQDIGRRIDGFTHGIDLPELTRTIQSVMTTGNAFEQQVRDQRGNWYLLRILPYHAKDAINGVGLTLIDLSNVKRAEAMTRAKDLQLSSILKNSPHLVYLQGLDGRFQVVDEAFRKVASIDPIGKTTHEVFASSAADLLTQHDQRVVREGTIMETEVVVPQEDGPHTFLVAQFPLRDESGQVVGVGGIGTDVTRLKTAERGAREAVAQRDHFLAMLSHELRNPLGAIVSGAAVLETGAADAETLRDATAVILRQSDQMRRLLDDLLDISRITQNKIHLRKETLRLDGLIPEAMHVIQSTADARQLTISVRNDEGPVHVVGDAARLQQMLVNLLTNAVKYTPSGGNVLIELRREADQAVLRVKDSGVGIRPDILGRVFDLFVQADDTLDRSSGGLGVGLTLVRIIAELHGGSVRASSAGPGQGSEFTVRLPLAAVSSFTSTDQADAGSPAPPSRILVVEDNDDSRRMLETFLKLCGHDVRVARDGEEGLRLILEERPAMALIDIGLPKLNGYELARRARESLGGEVVLVALTGYGRPEDNQSVVEAGFDEHIVKPAKRGDLERLIRRFDKSESRTAQPQATP
jgi:two-component system CheB/CheR fusion protein